MVVINVELLQIYAFFVVEDEEYALLLLLSSAAKEGVLESPNRIGKQVCPFCI